MGGPSHPPSTKSNFGQSDMNLLELAMFGRNLWSIISTHPLNLRLWLEKSVLVLKLESHVAPRSKRREIISAEAIAETAKTPTSASAEVGGCQPQL